MALGPLIPITLAYGATYSSTNFQAGLVGIMLYSDQIPLTEVSPLLDVNVWLLSNNFPGVTQNKVLNHIYQRQYRSSLYLTFNAQVRGFFQLTRIDTLPIGDAQYFVRFGNNPTTP